MVLEEWPGGVRITIPPRFSIGSPSIVELDDTALYLRNILSDPSSQETGLNLDRPRRDLYEVRFVGHSGNLFIRAHGHQIIDCRPHRDPKVVEWIAEELNRLLGLNTPHNS